MTQWRILLLMVLRVLQEVVTMMHRQMAMANSMVVLTVPVVAQRSVVWFGSSCIKSCPKMKYVKFIDFLV